MFLDTLLDGYLYLTGINIGRHGGHTVTFTCLLALPTRRAGPQAAGEGILFGKYKIPEKVPYY